jgi:hypothetical protein
MKSYGLKITDMPNSDEENEFYQVKFVDLLISG